MLLRMRRDLALAVNTVFGSQPFSPCCHAYLQYVAERNAAADKKVDARARQGTSKFRGVSMKKSWRSKLFQCSYYIPGPKRIQLYFKREEEAAHAYDRAQVEILGR